jgi:hypothetical protein
MRTHPEETRGMESKENSSKSVEEKFEARKRQWSVPSLEKLPRLTDLTLQTGDPVPGDEGVF